MKKQIVATLVLVISAIATATAGGKGETNLSSSKNITVTTGFTKLVVEGNVDVVLFEDGNTTDIKTFGKNSDLAATSIIEKNGVLTIINKKNHGEKVLIYVPVKNLRIIEAGGNAKVSTASAIQSESLTLVAKSDCNFNIRSTGHIEVEKSGDVELTVEENKISYASIPQRS